MEARLSLYGNSFAMKFIKSVNSAGAALTGSALINFYNRMSLITRQPAGRYQLG